MEAGGERQSALNELGLLLTQSHRRHHPPSPPLEPDDAGGLGLNDWLNNKEEGREVASDDEKQEEQVAVRLDQPHRRQ